MEEIKKQDFKSTDELNAFINNLIGQNLDDLPKRTDNKDRSQDLVYEAYEQPVPKAKKLIKQALELDPNNTDTYNYLASVEKNIDKAINLLLTICWELRNYKKNNLNISVEEMKTKQLRMCLMHGKYGIKLKILLNGCINLSRIG